MCKWVPNANMFYSICGRTPLSTREIKQGYLMPGTLDAVLVEEEYMCNGCLDGLHRFISPCWDFVVDMMGVL